MYQRPPVHRYPVKGIVRVITGLTTSHWKCDGCNATSYPMTRQRAAEQAERHGATCRSLRRS
ncbi:hypothetical protein [Kitasatospora sp. NPDC056181]|uniref:hypothetical protein n=1 Tax=Kitasatospora sp. NPDC056181 TaxID=3345737 RepID=UPI0035E08ED8